MGAVVGRARSGQVPRLSRGVGSLTTFNPTATNLTRRRCHMHQLTLRELACTETADWGADECLLEVDVAENPFEDGMWGA